MKFDYDKKHPFTSVNLIPEDKDDEYLTEEQTAEFKKIALLQLKKLMISTDDSYLELPIISFTIATIAKNAKTIHILGCGMLFLQQDLLFFLHLSRKLCDA